MDEKKKQGRRRSTLVLVRRAGEALRIGRDVKLQVTQVGTRQVTIAVIAPRYVPVRRAELAPEKPRPASGDEDAPAPVIYARRTLTRR